MAILKLLPAERANADDDLDALVGLRLWWVGRHISSFNIPRLTPPVHSYQSTSKDACSLFGGTIHSREESDTLRLLLIYLEWISRYLPFYRVAAAVAVSPPATMLVCASQQHRLYIGYRHYWVRCRCPSKNSRFSSCLGISPALNQKQALLKQHSTR